LAIGIYYHKAGNFSSLVYNDPMQPETIKELKHAHICELCQKHDPMVKDYSEDFELQTSIRDYVEKTTGEQINVSDIARLCDSCYFKVQDMSKTKDY
jgi:hypothetical protein